MSADKALVDERLARFVEPDYPGSRYVEWTASARALLDRRLCCEVCSAVPEPDGERVHGRGCYVIDEDGGGSDFFDVEDLLESLEAK